MSLIRPMKKRKFLYRILRFWVIVSSILMLWKSLKVITDCESPIILVMTDTMPPAFHKRGDLIFLSNYDPIRVGDIVAFKLEWRDVPIIHRVIRLHKSKNGTAMYLTKGDDNFIDDRSLYRSGEWLSKKDIIGKVWGYIPTVGNVVIWIWQWTGWT